MKQKDENNKPIATGKASGNSHQRRLIHRINNPKPKQLEVK